MLVDNASSCFETLQKWKNVSCIEHRTNQEFIILNFPNPDGSPAMKIAEPPIYPGNSTFYVFPDFSPHARKFEQVLQRIREASLLQWPGLVGLWLSYHTDDTEKATNDGIKLEHLLLISCIGFWMSIVIFIIELVISRTKTFGAANRYVGSGGISALNECYVLKRYFKIKYHSCNITCTMLKGSTSTKKISIKQPNFFTLFTIFIHFEFFLHFYTIHHILNTFFSLS